MCFDDDSALPAILFLFVLPPTDGFEGLFDLSVGAVRSESAPVKYPDRYTAETFGPREKMEKFLAIVLSAADQTERAVQRGDLYARCVEISFQFFG